MLIFSIPLLTKEASKGISLVPVLDKFNSLKKPAKKGNGSVTVFEYELLVAATNDFKEENILGDGGSGRVYKALFHGQLVAAVKRLKSGKLDAEKEFEVFIVHIYIYIFNVGLYVCGFLFSYR